MYGLYSRAVSNQEQVMIANIRYIFFGTKIGFGWLVDDFVAENMK
jgi:hypothetical protein